MNLGAAVEVERQVCQKLAPTPCISGKSILPPTRGYTVEEVANYLERSGVEAVLIVTLASDRSETRYVGTISSSTASGTSRTTGTLNLYGNSGVLNASTYGTASGTTISTPVYRNSREAYGQLSLYERGSGNIVWRGEIRVSGRGRYGVTDDAFIGSATSKIADDLKGAGLLR
jgi:hypothetical protein